LIWKPIPDYPGYKISDEGQIHSLRRKGTDGRILKPEVVKARGGKLYLRVRLGNKNVFKKLRVHRLVLLTFVGPPPNSDDHACHKNDDGFDNRMINLCWGTHKENQKMKRCRNCHHERSDHDETGQCHVPNCHCKGWRV
jgi:hypothetical protein